MDYDNYVPLGNSELVGNTNIAAAALKKLRDENVNALLQPLLNEAYRRAQADLRSKVAAREAATTAVRNAFNSPANFYDQLVARRTALKATADDIGTNEDDIEALGGRVGTNEDDIITNAGNIMANTGRIMTNRGMIGQNSTMIGELSESLEVVRAGVAASMALAGMPAINGRGISIGVGAFDGESAFALGFQVQSDTTSFKIGVTSAGGETGASAGVGFQF